MNTAYSNWIWLDPAIYPNYQTTKYNGLQPGTIGYTVADFTKTYSFDQKVVSAKLRFSADTEFRLLCNDKLVATGPFTIGGDFMANEEVRPYHYATVTELCPDSCELAFYARVKLMPCGINEYSKGRGGFMLSGVLTFEDGTQTTIGTDETWLSRRDPRYTAPRAFDGSQIRPSYAASVVVSDIWQATDAPLLPRVEDVACACALVASPLAEKTFEFDFDKIHAGFLHLKVKCCGTLRVKVKCLETDVVNSEESFVFTEDTDYTGLQLQSVGKFIVELINEADTTAEIDLSLATTYYPIFDCARTVTSDDALNDVLRLCEHSLKYCRQMIHLDSPKHSEPLACTGDYYIETLMTAFSYGDLSLSRFDVVRTADMLRHQEGVMFHTTYSMIWVYMLYDVYRYTGDIALLRECEDALRILLDRFATYVGDTGLVETPKSFMFIDWLYIDEISLHHPPKALGQTCLNMFYHKALTTAGQIYEALGRSEEAAAYREKAAALRDAINTLLYDADRDLYFEGLNTPTPEDQLWQYLPQNISKRYYRKHGNVLAVYCGVYEGDQAAFLRRVLTDESLGQFQPYFAHFVLEAVHLAGLSAEFTLPLCEDWKKAYNQCSKGLQEGFIKPEPTYHFDYSHAWGGTPRYAVPLALSGLKILEPGFKKIRLRPQLLGLEHALVEIPTPYGKILIKQRKNEKPDILCPAEIELLP